MSRPVRLYRLTATAACGPSTPTWLWLAPKGRLLESGVTQLNRRRGAEVGLKGLHPHAFRHAYAHQMLARGMQETDLMAIIGRRSRDMVARYAAASTRAE